MSAVIAFSGSVLDCDAISAVLPKAKICDERSRSIGSRRNKYLDRRSVNILVSRKGLRNLDGQIKDVIAFVGSNKVALQKAMKANGLEEAFISFGCTMEIASAAFYYFPSELALLAGEVNLGIRLSLFRCSDYTSLAKVRVSDIERERSCLL